MDFSFSRAISYQRSSSSYIFLPKNIYTKNENDFEYIFLSKVKVIMNPGSFQSIVFSVGAVVRLYTYSSISFHPI